MNMNMSIELAIPIHNVQSGQRKFAEKVNEGIKKVLPHFLEQVEKYSGQKNPERCPIPTIVIRPDLLFGEINLVMTGTVGENEIPFKDVNLDTVVVWNGKWIYLVYEIDTPPYKLLKELFTLYYIDIERDYETLLKKRLKVAEAFLESEPDNQRFKENLKQLTEAIESMAMLYLARQYINRF